MSIGFDWHECLQDGVHQAESYWRRGECDRAFETYRSLLAQRLASLTDRGLSADELSAADLLVIERLADLAVPFGRFQAADELLAGMASLCERAGNRLAADYASVKRLRLLTGRGLLLAAVQQLRSMAPSFGDVDAIAFTRDGLVRWEVERDWPRATPADRAVLFTAFHLEVGRLLAALGQYGDALGAYERGLHHAAGHGSGPDHSAILALRMAAASALLEGGDLAAADRELRDLRAELDAERRPDAAVRWAELAGKLFLLRGEFGAALGQFRQALDTCTSRGFRHAAYTATLDLAHVLILLNQTAVAEQVLFDARAASGAGDDGSAGRVERLLDLVRSRGQSLAEGVAIAPSVTDMWGAAQAVPAAAVARGTPRHLDAPQATSFLASFEDRALDFRWQLARGDLTAAGTCLDALTTAYGPSDSLLIRLGLRVMEAMVDYYSGRYERAEQALAEACEALAGAGLKHELWQAMRILGWCRARLGRDPSEVGALVERTERLLAEMTRSLGPSDQILFQLNKWTSDEEYIASRIDALTLTRRSLQGVRWYRGLRRRLKLLADLGSLLDHIDRYKAMLNHEVVTGRRDVEPEAPARPLWRRLLTHPRRRVTVSYLVLPDRMFVARAGWMSLDFGVSPVTRVQLRELVRRWHEAIRVVRDTADGRPPEAQRHVGTTAAPARSVSRLAEADRLSEQLANTLQLPSIVATLPKRTHELKFVADDILHGFPFGAFRHEGKYLVERLAVSIAFQNAAHGGRAPNNAGAGWLLAGVARGTSRISPLAGVREELERLHGRLSGHRTSVRRILDHEVDKPTLLASLQASSYAHIACHGVFNPDAPDSSGLLLIPAPESPTVLSIRELSGLDLTNLRHVTLSCCWSADYFALPGRWVIGLPETLWRAGARSILGSLWPVDDRLSVAFMERFYHLTERVPRAEALRRTQLDCLSGHLLPGEQARTAALTNWAGFCLYGGG